MRVGAERPALHLTYLHLDTVHQLPGRDRDRERPDQDDRRDGMISRWWFRMWLAIARWHEPGLTEEEHRARWHRLMHPELW